MLELSIVIPVYNVEKYLEDCLDSVLCNNKKNIEVILVDDGSTDRSGDICETYAENDSRVKVIHKRNGGLSSARNKGIQFAAGEYIGFVDSDDMIHELMYVDMLDIAHKHDADIVICGMRYFSNDISDTTICVHSEKSILVDGEEKFEFIISEKNDMGDFAQNKIYKRTLFYNIEYPEGKIFEDIYTSYKLFGKAKRVFCLNKDYYYYRLRNNSISHSKEFNPHMIDIVYATGEQLAYIQKNAATYLPFAYQKYLDATIIELRHLYINDKLNEEKTLVKQIRREIIELLKKDFNIFRNEQEARAIKKGIIYWKHCCQLTKIHNSLHIHPKLQKVWYSFFKKRIFCENIK